MRFNQILLILASLFILQGCYGTITGTVVDAETGQPIEGAVVLVEWTVTKGLGLTYTESYKVIEALTDKGGKVTISGVFNPLVNSPRVTVYKNGYVAWNNEYIFPDYKKRPDFKWKNEYVFRLDKFKPEYSYDKHIFFIHSAIGLGQGEKKLILKAIDWEESKAAEERQSQHKEGK